MNRRILYPILIVLVTVILYYAEDYVDRSTDAYPSQTTESINFEEFDTSFLPSSTTEIVIEHPAFAFSYNEKHEQAEWVAYELKLEHLSKNEFDRPYFIQDRSVESGSADFRNYKNSGYDRGHLCPAGDRRYDYNAYHQTFLTSNISPQDHDFNGGIWNRLEQKVRYWAKKYAGVFVVTGGILKDDLPTIGSEGVSVPGDFYKIVVDRTDGNFKAIAFLIPNKPSSESYFDFVVTIDEIEEKTGIDFFRNLDASLQNKLESQIDLKAWGRK